MASFLSLRLCRVFSSLRFIRISLLSLQYARSTCPGIGLYEFFRLCGIVGKKQRGPKLENFYTATEARKRLGLPRSTFFYLVKKGTIKKVVFPGMKQGVYPRAAIDELALTIKALIDQYEPSSVFEPAKIEDLPTEVEIDLTLYGKQGTTPLERRIERLNRNPESNFVLRRSGEIIGHCAFYPVEHDYLTKLLHAEVSGIPADKVLPWAFGTPLHVFFSIISVKAGFPRDAARHIGLRLLAGAVSVFRSLGSRGVIIETINATSRTPGGIKLAHDLGMAGELIGDEPGRWRFTLDIASSASLLAAEYKQAYQEFLQRTDKERR